MTEKFRIVQVNSKAEVERYGVMEFAAEFGHKPIGLPLLLFFHKDDLVAYVEVRHLPVLFPAVHPKVSPRIFLEGGRLLKQVVEDKYENGFVIYDYRSANFVSGLMKHLGFSRSPLKFYEVRKEEQNGSQSAINPEV